MKNILKLIIFLSFCPAIWGETISLNCMFYYFSDEEVSRARIKDGWFNEASFFFEVGKTQGEMAVGMELSKVNVQINDNTITFIQTEPTICTITTVELKTKDVVYSRHRIMGGEVLASQYYGKADIKTLP